MKQEQKNRRLTISLLLLLAATFTIVLINADPYQETDKDLFRIDNPDNIDRVLLESGGKKVELKYSNTGWQVNEKYAADGNMIRVLFATIMQNEPKRPVASRLRDSIATSLEKNGVRVTLMAEGQIVKTFIAGGNQAKTKAYFMDPVSEEVYLMAIPGYKVYVSGVYELDESGFRNKYVFAFKWQNFRGLDATFPGKPAENFKVSLQKDFFTIEGMPRVDTARLSTFLTDASLITAERFAVNETIDTLALPDILMEIAVFDVASRSYRLRIFNHEKNKLVLGQIGKEFAYFLPEKVKPLIRPRNFFKKR